MTNSPRPAHSCPRSHSESWGWTSPRPIGRDAKPLEDKVDELESALSARSPILARKDQPVTLASVQSALPADGALVEFAVYTPQDPRNNKNKLPPRYLAYLLARRSRADRPRDNFLATGAARPAPDGRQGWRAVDEKVMRPVLALAQSGFGAPRRLLIAPDGRSTSFHSPPSLTGRAATWSNVTRSAI